MAFAVAQTIERKCFPGPSQPRRKDTDAFGNPLASTQTGEWAGGLGGNRGLTTKELDPAAGMYYFYQRWYDPQTATFASRAPYPSMVEHPYTLTEQSPVHLTDPRGMYSWEPGWDETIMASEWLHRALNRLTRRKKDGCCDTHLHAPMPTKEELETAVDQLGTVPSLAGCIKKQIHDAKVTCETACSARNPRLLGYAYVGTIFKPTGEIWLCADNLETFNCGTNDIGNLMIHEYAHTCGWGANHPTGYNIPGEGSGSLSCTGN